MAITRAARATTATKQRQMTISFQTAIDSPSGTSLQAVWLTLSTAVPGNNTGLAAFTAILNATGIDAELNSTGDYILSIDGIKERGDMGWKFAVNGKTVEGKSIKDIIINDGDSLWFFYGAPSTPVY